MANICNVSLIVAGPTDVLEAFREMVVRDTEPIGEGPFADEFILTLKKESWGDLEGTHDFLWIKTFDHHNCQRVLGPAAPIHDELRIHGESKWAAPAVFAQRIIDRFPDLEVDLHGTTEHEDYEHWQSEWVGVGEHRQHKLVCRREELTNLQTGDVLRLVVDGKQILPREASTTTPSAQ